MTEAQIQLERNKLKLYERERKHFSTLYRHYVGLIKEVTLLIAEMEAEMEAELEAEAEAEAEAPEG